MKFLVILSPTKNKILAINVINTTLALKFIYVFDVEIVIKAPDETNMANLIFHLINWQ